MSQPRIRMVCFDAGGVLVRICRSWREGCHAAGIEHRWSADAEAGEPLRQTITNDYQRGRIRCEEFFQQIAATTAGLYAAGEVRAVHDAWILGEYRKVEAAA